MLLLSGHRTPHALSMSCSSSHSRPLSGEQPLGLDQLLLIKHLQSLPVHQPMYVRLAHKRPHPRPYWSNDIRRWAVEEYADSVAFFHVMRPQPYTTIASCEEGAAAGIGYHL